MRLESSITSISWIPSEAVRGYLKAGFSVGLTHYDSPPPDRLGDVPGGVQGLRDTDAFRFANQLTAWAEFDGAEVVAFGQAGGLVLGSTTLRVGPADATYAAVAMPELRPDPVVERGSVTFCQTVGGRTGLPIPRRIHRAPFVRLSAPLVWTTLRLTLRSDGSSELELAGASPFPRHWVYDHAGDVTQKAGVADFAGWVEQPSWKATPWGDQDSPVIVTAAESELERRLSMLLMQGARAPHVHNVQTGTQLTREGEPADTLYLVLDGVLAASVGGAEVATLGPGAVVGERAILSDSRRTATLTATTPVRVAEAPADAVDRALLAELARGHARETAGA